MLGGLGPAGAWGGTSQGLGPQGESEPDAMDTCGVCLPSLSVPGASWPSDGGQHVPKVRVWEKQLDWEVGPTHFTSKARASLALGFSLLQSNGASWELSKVPPSWFQALLPFPSLEIGETEAQSKG